MREFLDHSLTREDIILAISLFGNFLTVIGLLVVMDVRFTYWRQRRAWRKQQREQSEHHRNPTWGLRGK